MTLVACLSITAIVWLVSIIRSVRLRALVYTLPLPITAVLLFTPSVIDGSQLFGVVLLNVFFLVVTTLHHGAGWHIGLADVAGVATYVGLGTIAAWIGQWPFLPTLTAVLVLWAATALTFRPAGKAGLAQPDHGLSKPVKLVVVFCGSLLSVGLGSLLHGLIVTFPYSGILVAIESRRDLPEFSRHFARNSIGLVAFLVAYHYAPGDSETIAIAAGWTAFAACALLLNLTWLWRRA